MEADGRRILFDTGLRPDTVLRNARELGIDLSGVTDVVLSHHHEDHTGGLLALRRELSKASPSAMSRIHVAPGIFLSLTGPVPRPNPERYWGSPASIVTANGLVPDSIPEDMSLLVNTDRGFVVVAGCGHAGTINTVEYARRVLGAEPAYAIIGGLHPFAAPDSALAWTAARLHSARLGYLLGAHCTGIEAVFRIRELATLGRKRALVAAVGASFEAGKGIDPLSLAQ